MTIHQNNPLISVVVPVYKDHLLIKPFLEQTIPVLEQICNPVHKTYEILFCLDPAKGDPTYETIMSFTEKNPSIKLIYFGIRNGQYKSTLAGIFNATGTYCVTMDVDLQDPPEVIPKMYAKIQTGYNLVNGIRKTRPKESLLYRFFSMLAYWIFEHIGGLNIKNVGDFRMMDSKIITILKRLPEQHAFIKGLVQYAGLQQTAVYFNRTNRLSGKTHYNFYRSFILLFNALTGYSTILLTYIMWLGIFIILISLLFTLIFLIRYFILAQHYPLGIPTITLLVLFTGGIQIFAIGLIGEYLGRVYMQTLKRPRYIIQETKNFIHSVDPIDPYI